MQSFLDKIKGIFNKDKFGKAGVFFVENKRYFAAALLFVILVLVLKFGTNPKNMKDNQIADTQKPQEENNGDFSFDIEYVHCNAGDRSGGNSASSKRAECEGQRRCHDSNALSRGTGCRLSCDESVFNVGECIR